MFPQKHKTSTLVSECKVFKGYYKGTTTIMRKDLFKKLNLPFQSEVM